MTLLWQSFPMLEGRRAQAWRHRPEYRRPAHFHDQPEINLVVRGSATFVVGRRRVSMTAGSLFWYPPGLDHFLEFASEDFELYVVGYERELLEAFEREHGVVLGFARPLQQLDGPTLRECVAALSGASEATDHVAVEQTLLEVVASLARASSVERPPLGCRAAELLADDPTLGRDELTRRLASNRGDVSRAFRRDQGLSLTEYKNRLCASKLLALLDRGHVNLTLAAFEAGFGSYSRCHQVVRGFFDMAPSALLDPGVRRALADHVEPLAAQEMS